MQTKKNNFYYVITDNSTENILISKNLQEIFVFITKNPKSKLSTINYKRKPRILGRCEFLKTFLEKGKDQNKFFELSKILIGRRDDLRKFIATQNLLSDFDYYEQNKNNVL